MMRWLKIRARRRGDLAWLRDQWDLTQRLLIVVAALTVLLGIEIAIRMGNLTPEFRGF